MITQTLKNWFRKLFAWWPWKRSTQVSYSQPASGGNRNNVQESLRCTAANSTEPAYPWTEGTSIAVEPEIMDDSANDSPYTTRQELSTSSPTVRPSRTTDRLPPLTTEQNEQFITSTSPDPTSDNPISEQHLTFLRYLVKQGVFNEGFPNGQEPDQYRQR